MSAQHEIEDQFTLDEMSERKVVFLRTARTIRQAIRETRQGLTNYNDLGGLSVKGSLSLTLETPEGKHYDLVPADQLTHICLLSLKTEEGEWEGTLNGLFSHENPIPVTGIVIDINNDGSAPIRIIGKEREGQRREFILPDFEWMASDYQLWSNQVEANLAQ